MQRKAGRASGAKRREKKATREDKLRAMSSKKKELARLRSIADAGLEAFGPRTGQKFSYERAVAVAVCLCTIFLMLPAAMVSTVIKTVAQVEHLRWTKVKEVWTKLEAGYDAGNIPDALDEYLDVQDGRTGNSELQIEMQSLVAAHYGMIDTFIQDDLIQESIPVTASSVQSIIRDKLQIDVSQRTCSRVLKRLGYRYGKLRKQMLLTRTRKLRIRKFLMDYARAKKLEAAGTHIIVNMDESFVHTRHARTMGYHLGREAEGIVNNAFLHNTDDGRQGESTDSRGQRLIILHAMTKDGLLFGDAAQKARGISETAIGTDYENAEWVFQADARVKDYHKNMDGFMFSNWLEHMLLPAFKAKYPDKTMILFMDNAPYHRPIPANGISVSKTSRKADLLPELHALGITEVTVDRGGQPVTFGADTFEDRGGPNAPTCAELAAKINEVAAEQCPELLLDMTTALSQAHGFELLWGAPYNPKFAAVELLWAFSKNRVAREYSPSRSLTATATDLYTAWYGGETRRTKKVLEPFTATTAYKFQVRAEVEMNRWIELHGGDVGLSGTVGDLTDTGVPGDAADNACSGGDSDVEDGDYADDGMGDAAAELDD